MKKYLLNFALIFVLAANSANAQTVSNNTDLQTAITNATAGSTIVLAAGTWTNTYININKTGTLTQPITIKAETPGQVFLEGNSRIAMGGEYVKVEGLVFRNPSNLVTGSTTIEPVIKFRDGSSKTCSNCSATNIKIDSYNGTAEQSSLTFKWVLLYGQRNEISYCSFIGKYGIGSVINDNRDVVAENYTKIHHNYFADRTYVGSYVDQNNDQDAIRIGNSSTSLSDSFTEVYDNLFYNWSGEIEVISNKSGHNKYYNNTFRDYSGSLTLRHGNYCEVFNNFFFANNREFSGAIRVVGENHKVYNNYIEAVNSAKSAAAGGGSSSNLGGINVIKGRENTVLNGYYQVKNLSIINNTFVNCDSGIKIGGGSEKLPPLDLEIANNIFLMNSSSKKAVDEIIAADASYPYTFTGNIRQSGTWTLNGNLSSNQIVSSDLLTSDSDFYRVKSASAAVDAGKGIYTYLTSDILGGNRPTLFDAGAEEFGANGIKYPYKVTDVGSKIGFLGTNTLSVFDNSLKSGIKVYPVPVKLGGHLNIESIDELGNIAVYDITGKLLYAKKCTTNTLQIETSSFTRGIYILKINDGATRFVIE